MGGKGKRFVAPTIPSEVITPNNPPTGWGILEIFIVEAGKEQTIPTTSFSILRYFLHIHSRIAM